MTLGRRFIHPLKAIGLLVAVYLVILLLPIPTIGYSGRCEDINGCIRGLGIITPWEVSKVIAISWLHLIGMCLYTLEWKNGIDQQLVIEGWEGWKLKQER